MKNKFNLFKSDSSKLIKWICNNSIAKVNLSVLLISCVSVGGFCSTAFSKSYEEKTKTITKEFKVTAQNEVTITHERGDIEVEYFEGNTAKIEVHLTVRGDNASDLEIMLSKFTVDIQTKGNEVDVNSSFNISKMNKRTAGIFGKSSSLLKFKDGTSIKTNISDVNAHLKLWIPTVAVLGLVNKHEDITVSDLSSALEVSLFDGTLTTGDIDGSLQLVLKHGDAIIGDVGNSDLDLFDSDLVMGDAEYVNLVAKHSDIAIGDMNEADMDLFDSAININTVASYLNLIEKHSKIIAAVVENGDWAMFDSKVEIKKAGSLRIKGKHGQYQIGQVNKLILETFDTQFKIDEVETINSSSSRHSKFKIVQLGKSINYEKAFDVRIDADRVGPDFSKINFDGKHSTIDVALPAQMKYRVDISMKHGRFGYEKNDFEINEHVEKGGEFIFKGVVKGGMGNTPVIKIRGEDVEVDLK